MSELFPVFNNFLLNNPDLVTWGIAALMLIFGVFFKLSDIKECISEWKLNHLLENSGADVLHNVTIPDGMDGNIFIEYLILTPRNIILLGVKKYKGLIFAAEKIDLWTQVIGNKSYKFNNPLLQLENDRLALKSIVENSEIVEKVLFINGSEFPKGKPDNVVSVSDVNNWTRYSEEDIPKSLLDDWKQLSFLAIGNDLSKSIIMNENKSSNSNMFSLITILMFTVLWLVWRLVY